MKKITALIVAVTALVVFVGCASEKKRLSGNPSEVLDADTYNKLQQQYKSIMNFQKGTAIVKKELYGLIDEKGNEVLPCIYDSISSFLKHFRVIKKDSSYGVVNIDGEIIKQCVYSAFMSKEAYTWNSVCNYLALKLNDKWGFIDSVGNDVTQYKYEEIRFYDDSAFTARYEGYFGVSDYHNNVLIPYKYDEINYKSYEKCPVTRVKLNEMYGLYNSKNEQVLPCEYGMFFVNENGYITVRKNESSNYKTTRKALVEAETGKIMIPFDYMDMGDYSEGLVSAENLEEKWGFLDLNGNIVIPFIYEDAGDFSEGLAPVYKVKGYGYNRFGKIPIHSCGYIDKKGNVVIPFNFVGSHYAAENNFHEGLAVQGVAVSHFSADVFGYINTKGEWVVRPKYDDANPFRDGWGEVVLNDKYGYVNTKGEQILPCIYDEYGGYFINDSVFMIKKDGEPCYFNKDGKPINYK